MIILGITATDRITGFSGVITGLCHYISGCSQALVTPKVAADGALREPAWFDLQRLDPHPDTAVVTLANGATPGFDKPAPKR
jgi:hypothetical protein